MPTETRLSLCTMAILTVVEGFDLWEDEGGGVTTTLSEVSDYGGKKISPNLSWKELRYYKIFLLSKLRDENELQTSLPQYLACVNATRKVWCLKEVYKFNPTYKVSRHLTKYPLFCGQSNGGKKSSRLCLKTISIYWCETLWRGFQLAFTCHS